jgi:predicted nucleotidyltransferase
MEQKDYKLEIVNVLVKGENHIRAISNYLGINHMMIFRKITDLEKENVVDFIRKGRNKIYFLKNSPEARSYVLMTEYYKLNKLLLKYAFLREVVLKIQKDKKVKFACFFGSYSKGNEKKSSDVDIYLDINDLNLKKKYSNLDSKFSVKIGKWDKSNLLIKEIIENHIIIKGGEIYYERVFN